MSVADLKDLSSFIQKLGQLTETNATFESNSSDQLQLRSSSLYQSSQYSQNNGNSTNYFSYSDNHPNQPQRQRQTWDRQPPPMDNFAQDIYQIYQNEGLTPRNNTNQLSSRSDHPPQPQPPVAGPRANPPPAVSFTIGTYSHSPPTLWLCRPSSSSPNPEF